jgi:uncharacterized Zn finger protein
MPRWEPWYYEPTVRRPVKDGLKARGGRAGFSKTWWGKRWIQALEAFGWDNRLARGRSYARSGQVVDLEVTLGQVAADVQGSQPRPYRVTIGLKPLTEQQWEQAFQALAGQAAYSAQLLAGEMPAEIDEVMANAQASLFPTTAGDLMTECSCPDWVNPCKHVAAVHYLLAEEIDRDPFLLFTLRGKDREAMMLGLRRARGAEAAAAAGSEAPAEAARPLSVETFWETGTAMADWRVIPAPPAVPDAVLRRLGPPDFADDPQSLQTRLQTIYAQVTGRALETSLAESTRAAEPASDETA